MADSTLPAAPVGTVSSGSSGVALDFGENTQGKGDFGQRLFSFLSQPGVRQALPAAGAFMAILMAGMAYLSLSAGPSRVLYSGLTDNERAQVAEALDSGGIAYSIDAGTGRITVAEDDIYRARMLVASNTGLATPQSATDMLDNIPMGASRTMEGERLRLAHERELMMTIQEIDGISSARVHLATPERSVFVRDKSPATASVMVRLARGRSLGKEQVDAIVNLVSGSVPGLTPEAVRVVDQNGRLLSTESETALDGLLLQSEFEAKLRDQVAQLLTPMLGEGKFSTEVQVALERSEVTSARETYEPEGKIRSESETSSTRRADGNAAGGVPGVLANTPPPPADLVEEAPNPAGEAEAEAQNPPTDSETSARRNYELDREVAVTTSPSGRLTRISVAVAVDAEALAAIAPADEAKLQELVSAAVGADEERGDVVNVMSSAFEEVTAEDPPFYEAGWFDPALRYGGRSWR
jgi:flagellar M-ring protein FliF